MLSVFELPLSLAAVRSGTDGAAGAAASIVTLRALEAVPVLPARSVALAVMLCGPSLRVTVLVMVQLPLPLAAAVPTGLPSLKSVTALLASAVPLNVGIVLRVRLSVFELPV